MTSERVSAVSAEEEEDAALGYYDDEDDLEAFSDGELGCEDGGRRIFVLRRKVTGVHGTLSLRLSLVYSRCLGAVYCSQL